MNFDNEKSAISKYYSELSKIPVLSNSEEQQVFKQMLNTKCDEEINSCKIKLIEHNLRYVVTVSKSFIGKGLSLGDLIANGNIGLLRAIEKFDPGRGVKFITYATHYIQMQMSKALKDEGRCVRLPDNVINNNNRIQKEISKMVAKDGYFDEIEVAKTLWLPIGLVKETLCQIARNVSMEDPLGEDGNSTRLDTFSCDNKDIHEEEFRKRAVQNSIKKLPQRSREIITKYYGIGLQYPISAFEIGKEYNLTETMIQKIIRESKEMLRNYLENVIMN